MAVDDYPQLCARFDAKHPSDEVICVDCKARVKWDPGEGDPYDLCSRHEGCGGELSFRWVEGVECPNCGHLDYSQPYASDRGAHRGEGTYCSRACALQHEYAQELEKRQALTVPTQAA